MALDKILISSSETGRVKSLDPDVERGWRWIAWFSLVLAVAGLGDWVLAWVPLHFGSPEWEFGTVVSSFSGLPLVTMGLAGLLGSAVARRIRWQVIAVSSILLIWAAVILAALGLFLLDVPLALGAVQGPARLGIIKAIVKCVMLGMLFSLAYIVAGIGALRGQRPGVGRIAH